MRKSFTPANGSAGAIGRKRMSYLLLAIALTFPGVALGDDLPDKFKIQFGSFFVTDIDTTVSLAKTGGAVEAGARIDFEDQLGLDDSEAVGRIDGYYRFGKKSRVDFSYWKIDRDTTHVIAEPISIGDISINVNQTVRTQFDSETLKAAYGWSFYNVPKAELGLLAGLHLTTIDLEVTDLTGGAGSEQADSPIPLPVVGFYLRYNISQRWRFLVNTQFFALDFEDFEGSLTDLRVNVEHHTFKNAGFGFGFNRISFDLEAEDRDDDLRGTVKNNNEGFLAYVFVAFGKAKYQQ